MTRSQSQSTASRRNSPNSFSSSSVRTTAEPSSADAVGFRNKELSIGSNVILVFPTVEGQWSGAGTTVSFERGVGGVESVFPVIFTAGMVILNRFFEKIQKKPNALQMPKTHDFMEGGCFAHII